MKHTILITGGSGLIGKKLTALFTAKGHDVRHLGRGFKNREAEGLYYWNPLLGEIDEKSLKGATILIHLAGESVAGKSWSEERKKNIIDSRVKSTELLVETINKTGYKPQKVIAASATGYYGAVTGPHIFIENDAPGKDFLAQVCVQWEEASSRFEKELHISLAIMRIGVVLAREGGALQEIVKPMRFAMGAVLGTGKQWVPWIHIDDLAAIMGHLVNNQELTGVYNAVSPGHANFEVLTKASAKSLNRFVSPFNIPGAALRMALGEQSVIVLEGSRVSSKKISETGYTFLYPEIQRACDSLLKSD
ncbi:MAG: TIGR01777 family oxidoreductase [Flavobacteriales bacterium]|nr:TIGR01777 family oxidoreductase [Flavobacteriales bacterium]